jgi:hypothetical protein
MFTKCEEALIRELYMYIYIHICSTLYYTLTEQTDLVLGVTFE